MDIPVALTKKEVNQVLDLLWEAGMLLADGEDEETRGVLKRIDKMRHKLIAKRDV